MTCHGPLVLLGNVTFCAPFSTPPLLKFVLNSERRSKGWQSRKQARGHFNCPLSRASGTVHTQAGEGEQGLSSTPGHTPTVHQTEHCPL